MCVPSCSPPGIQIPKRDVKNHYHMWVPASKWKTSWRDQAHRGCTYNWIPIIFLSFFFNRFPLLFLLLTNLLTSSSLSLPPSFLSLSKISSYLFSLPSWSARLLPYITRSSARLYHGTLRGQQEDEEPGRRGNPTGYKTKIFSSNTQPLQNQKLGTGLLNEL